MHNDLIKRNTGPLTATPLALIFKLDLWKIFAAHEHVSLAWSLLHRKMLSPCLRWVNTFEFSLALRLKTGANDRLHSNMTKQSNQFLGCYMSDYFWLIAKQPIQSSKMWKSCAHNCPLNAIFFCSPFLCIDQTNKILLPRHLNRLC